MSLVNLVRAVPRRFLVIAAIAVVVASALPTILGAGTKHGVAYFASVTSVYPHDKVRILGVEVGTIDKITAEHGKVRVDFSFDGSYDLPANVRAAVVSPTLVATRFMQLEPAYVSGPTFEDGGTIPISRTASPLEFDDLKGELSRLSKDLGPQGGANGPLAEFLNTAAANGQGKGGQFNRMITELSKGLHTLSEGRGDIFGTLRNLQAFVVVLKGLDAEVTTFNTRMADVSDLLDDNGDDLTAAIESVDRAANLVTTFLGDNRGELRNASIKMASLTTALAESRDDIATLLHVGPSTLTNFYNIFSPRMSSFTGGLMVDNLATPGQLVCTLIAQQTGAPTNDLTTCGKYLAPLLDQLGISQPPVGTNGGLVIPGGGGPPAPAAKPTSESGSTTSGGSVVSGSNGLLSLLIPGGN